MDALETVCEDVYFDQQRNEAITTTAPVKGLDTLNTRELEFLKLFCSERTYKAVAREMNLSPKTIDGYREDLFNKLEVKNRIGLVLFAVKMGLLKL